MGFTNKPALIDCFQSGRYGHRIRHYGLLANGGRAENIAKARALLAVPPRVEKPRAPAAAEPGEPRVLPLPCPWCGGRMIVIEVFARGCEPRHRPSLIPAIGINSS